jgi:glycine C-acetyltransferase
MPLESTCTNKAIIYDEVAGKSREFLMFGSNSYLGLSAHPQVISAIQDAAGRYGATNTGCRIIAGSNVLHLELERKLAKLKGRESCIVYPSGYSANLGAISALVGRNDLVFTDNINHMSIQDGCKLSGASRKLYAHSLSSLEKSLAKYADQPGGKLIVTDGVFSMHGDIVDLPRLVKLADQYGARVLVDDAHSTGVLGATGSGTTEHFNMKGQVDLEMGTLSKSLSGLGGFICADEEIVEYLRFYSNSYVFAATIPAPVAAGVIASIDVMINEPQRLKQLWHNIRYIRSKLLNLGFDLENSDSAIIPIVVGNDRITLDFGRAVRARGLFCQTVVFPGVAVGDARLRMSITSEHTQENLDRACEILTDAALEVGVKFAQSSLI